MPMTLLEKVTLNDLIATTWDSIDDYLNAADNVESDSLVALFDKRVVERQSAIEALCSEVIRLGGKPQESGSLSASAHRMLFNLRSVLTGRNEKTVIEEVARRESYIRSKFENAIADTDLSSEVRRAIRDCYASINNHNNNSITRHHNNSKSSKHFIESDQSPPV
jgi:uncharacterized protein (TIGR02284 family)